MLILAGAVGLLLIVGVVALLLTLRGDPQRLPPPGFPRSDPFAPRDDAGGLPPASFPQSPFAPPRFEVDVSSHDDVVALLRAGDKIGAIKLFRERSGASLAEAKNLIEAWAVHGARIVDGPPLPLPAHEPARVLPIEMRPLLLEQTAQLAAHDRIGAIKHWRSATGASLGAAKNLVEALAEHGAAHVPSELILRAWPSDSGAVAAEPGPPPVLPSPREAFEPPPLAAGERESLLAECVAIARGGDKIGAIKRFRERTGCGLAEAKTTIERAVG